MRASEHPNTAPAARAAPWRRKKRCHGAQTRPRGANLGFPSPPLPTGPTLERQCDATARRSRDGARIRTQPNTPKWPRGQPRLRARRRGSEKKRCHGAQTRPRGASLGTPPPPVPTGPTLVRQCNATARRSRDGARVRAPPNTPKWPRGRPRRRARASRRRKRSHRPQTRPRDVNLGPLSPPVPPGAALMRRCVVTARYGP